MSITDQAVHTGRQLATDPTGSRAWWFLGTLAVVRNPEGAPRTPAVIELTVPPGGSPPEHVHEELDDSFLLLDGEVVVRCGEDTVIASPGTYVVLPHGVPHTFRVTSRTPARMLLIHADDSFLRFIEAIGTPTDERQLPPPTATSLDPDEVARASAAHGSPLVGPPLADEDARRALPPKPTPAPLGAINHISLSVTDVRKSERWYVDALGLIRIDGEIADDGSGHVALMYPAGGWVVGLASAPTAGVEHVAFTCPDREGLVTWRDELIRRGVAAGSITDAPYGSGYVVRDPDGVELELFAPPAPVSNVALEGGTK